MTTTSRLELGGRPVRQPGRRPSRNGWSAALAFLALAAWPAALAAGTVAVLHPESAAHRALVLRAPGGATLAHGELTQTTSGSRVTTRVVFHFDDGSVHDETVTYEQDGRFRLINDRLVQHGPAFPRTLDMTIDAEAGEVRVRATEPGSEPKEYDERIALPADTANGMIPTLLKNVSAGAAPESVAFVVATPRPRLVRLVLGSTRRERLQADDGAPAAAEHFVLKVEIGGIAGRLAPIFGKQPPDSHVWILQGDPPEYARSDQPFYVGGPLWRIEVLPQSGAARKRG